MRISVKVAPGVRVSGHIGGHRHRHYHRHTHPVRASAAKPRGPWLCSIPPWRLPPMNGAVWLIAAMLFLELWLLEFELWLFAWTAIGTWHAARWLYHKNPIGQTIDSIHRARARRRPATYDPHAAPPAYVDLSRLGQSPAPTMPITREIGRPPGADPWTEPPDPWDAAPMRRRG